MAGDVGGTVMMGGGGGRGRRGWRGGERDDGGWVEGRN